MPPSLDRLPTEIFTKIAKILSEDDTYKSRKALGNLRLAGDRRIPDLVVPQLLVSRPMGPSLHLWIALRHLALSVMLSPCQF